MRIVVFINQLGIGGSEKAACCWAQKLRARGHQLRFLVLKDGPRRAELDGIDVLVVPPDPAVICHRLREFQPDVVHVHAPGHPHQGDILGEALKMGKKLPVVQTNIFGQLNNPVEDQWVDFRLFISWTSSVQAARRSFQRLNESFFRRASVAVYPVDPDDGPEPSEIQSFRSEHGVQEDEILFGRLSRPEPNKWTDLPINAFRIAARQHYKIKLLLREPPPEVRAKLDASSDRDKFVVLPATSDLEELRHTIASLDVALHTSSVGESFGYGIAEPMNFGIPVIANSAPGQATV